MNTIQDKTPDEAIPSSQMKPTCELSADPKLILCAHCSNEAVVRRAAISGSLAAYWVECSICEISTKFSASPLAAAKVWNTRVAPWQPIETAPKDTDVLVFAMDGYEKIGTARFHTHADSYSGWWQWDQEYETRGIFPTHWMPLPAEPIQATASSASDAPLSTTSNERS